jgi:catechol 2,3-dioxygenase-like lactoylglutathione lyase family enzyme
MNFGYTILYVDDARTLRFFEQALGLDRAFLHESGDYGELATGDTKPAFSSRRLMRQRGKNPKAPVAAAPTFEIAFETSDVAGAVARAVEAWATLVQDARDEPWGRTTAYVSDPDGYLVEICTPVRVLAPA